MNINLKKAIFCLGAVVFLMTVVITLAEKELKTTLKKEMKFKDAQQVQNKKNSVPKWKSLNRRQKRHLVTSKTQEVDSTNFDSKTNEKLENLEISVNRLEGKIDELAKELSGVSQSYDSTSVHLLLHMEKLQSSLASLTLGMDERLEESGFEKVHLVEDSSKSQMRKLGEIISEIAANLTRFENNLETLCSKKAPSLVSLNMAKKEVIENARDNGTSYSINLNGTSDADNATYDNDNSTEIFKETNANKSLKQCLQFPPVEKEETGFNVSFESCSTKNLNFLKTALKTSKALQSYICSAKITSLTLHAPLHPSKHQCSSDVLADWMTIQRRGKSRSDLVPFNRSWEEYKNGFGDLCGDFWLGNELIHRLTTGQDYSLQVKFFDLQYENARVVTYDRFWIDSEDNDYALHVDGFNTLDDFKDGLNLQNKSPFQTYDHASSTYGLACATYEMSGWWFTTTEYLRVRQCNHHFLGSNLNAPYGEFGTVGVVNVSFCDPEGKASQIYKYGRAIYWRGRYVRNKDFRIVEMKIRPQLKTHSI